MRNVRSLWTVPLTLSLIFLSSCTSASEVVQENSSIAPRITDADQVTRPMDAFFPDVEQIVALEREKEAQVNECIQEAGAQGAYVVDYDGLSSYLETAISSRVTRSPMWGFFDTRADREDGYALTASGVFLAPALPSDASETCFSVSESGDDPITLVMESALPNGGPLYPIEDADYLNAVTEWSACMRRSGFSYSSPVEPLAHFYVNPAVEPDEVRTVDADLACKIETNLVGKGMAALKSSDDAYIERNRAALTELSSQIEVAIAGGRSP